MHKYRDDPGKYVHTDRIPKMEQAPWGIINAPTYPKIALFRFNNHYEEIILYSCTKCPGGGEIHALANRVQKGFCTYSNIIKNTQRVLRELVEKHIREEESCGSLKQQVHIITS